VGAKAPSLAAMAAAALTFSSMRLCRKAAGGPGGGGGTDRGAKGLYASGVGGPSCSVNEGGEGERGGAERAVAVDMATLRMYVSSPDSGGTRPEDIIRPGMKSSGSSR
jgi:hypothetical protein